MTLLFSLAMFSTLLQGEWLLFARAGWTFLVILFVIDIRYSLYTIFFSAAFFHPSTFLPNHFFTLKHFHIALALTLVVQITKNQFWKNLVAGIKISRPLIYLILIISIGFIPFYRQSNPFSFYKVALNFLMVLSSFVYISGMIKKNEALLRHCLLLFTLGVTTHIIIAFLNFSTNSNFLGGLSIVHNNHLGVLSSFAVFHAIGYALSTSKISFKIFGWLNVFLIFSALVLSCSRTSWFSFFISYLIFINSFQSRIYSPPSWKKQKRLVIFGSIFIFLMIVFFLFKSNLTVSERIGHLYQVADFRYWKFTLNDYQNFGFLGAHRLRQINELWSTLHTNPLLGRGFNNEVFGYHGFYYVVLGGSGLIGLALFFVFIRTLLVKLIRTLHNNSNSEKLLILKICILCAMIDWLLCSVMETLFLQFSVWINIVACLIIIQPNKGKETG